MEKSCTPNACGLLVVTRFEGCVTNALVAWGFTVKAAVKAAMVEEPVPAA